MLFIFFIKDNRVEIDVMVTRALLAIAAIAALVFRSGSYFFLNLVSACALLIAALCVRYIFLKFRISKILLFTIAAVLLFMATRSISFALILLLYGSLFNFFYKQPTIIISENGVSIHKTFSNPSYQWNEFNNIILKDNLLTFDFKNNRLMQLNIDPFKTEVAVKPFNDFCLGEMHKASKS